jgi:hypothetical protein
MPVVSTPATECLPAAPAAPPAPEAPSLVPRVVAMSLVIIEPT